VPHAGTLVAWLHTLEVGQRREVDQGDGEKVEKGGGGFFASFGSGNCGGGKKRRSTAPMQLESDGGGGGSMLPSSPSFQIPPLDLDRLLETGGSGSDGVFLF
jgi:hypothetical protein